MIDLLTDMSLLALWLIIMGGPIIIGAFAVAVVVALLERLFWN